MSLSESVYKRVLLKISGEFLSDKNGFGISMERVQAVAERIANTKAMGVEMAVVVGGGNLFRGLAATSKGFQRATGDYIGMLATVMNALSLQAAMDEISLDSRVVSAISINKVAEPYIRRRAVRHLEKGRVVIFAAGTGNPYFTTDTAAALRAAEIGADILLKGTKVDGVYSADPITHPDAEFFPEMTHSDALERRVGVMDATALTMCRENEIPIVVFNFGQDKSLERILSGARLGTHISNNRRSE